MERVRQRALSIAADLAALGVRTGDRVASCCRPAQICRVLVRRAVRGAIPVPLYPPVRLGRLEEYHAKTAAMLSAVDAALVVTDERIRRFLGTAVERAAPHLGCVTASSLNGVGSLEIQRTADKRGVDPILFGHNARPQARGAHACQPAVKPCFDRALPHR